MPPHKLNLAMIGTGSIAKAHSNAFRQVGHFFDIPYALNLRVVCGRDQGKLVAAAARWGWAETVTDWLAVVGRPGINVVLIAVPHSLHAPLSIPAVHAGG